MRKSKQESNDANSIKVIKPKEAAAVVIEWRNNPSKENRDKVFMLLIETSKAVIGKLQRSYNMQVKDYNDKVIDSACKLMEVLDKKPDLIPNNIVSWAYLYILGLVFNRKLVQQESELLIDDYLTDQESIYLAKESGKAVYKLYYKSMEEI